MGKRLLTLQSVELFTGRALRIAVRIAGGDVEGIQQPQAILQTVGRGRYWDPVGGNSHPQAREGYPRLTVPRASLSALRAFISGQMGRKACPFVALSLHGGCRLLQIAASLGVPIAGTVSHPYWLSLSTAMKASWGTSTRPIAFIRFLPLACFCSSFFLRLMSPP
jgi:hypothetical protein